MIRPTLLAGLLFLSGAARESQGDDPRLAGYRTPAGWKVEIAATEPLVVNPVTMTFGDDGRLYVVEWQAGRGPNDRIKVLTDKDGDGTFDEAAIYMDGLDLPAGVLFWDGWTYVTLEHDVVRFKDEDGDGKFEKRESIVTGFGNDNSHHRVSGLTLGPDGWLYITTGDSDAHAKGSDGSTATVLRCGGVFRCKPDGSRLEMYAMGMRNPFGNVAFDDEFHIFHTDNDNEGSAGFTGCRLLHVVEGGDYGWRLREGARCCQPDVDRATWNGGRPGRLGSITETGRGAPAGLAVLNSAAFPPSTRNLLIYPDVFRKLVRAYKLRPAGASFTVDREFNLLQSDDPLFRPDDAEVGPDGALYILDWRTDSGGAGQLSGNGKTGRIYRLTWSGTDAEPARATLPRDRFAKQRELKNEELVEALHSKDYQARYRSGLELIRRQRTVLRSLMSISVYNETSSFAGRHLMAVTAGLPWERISDLIINSLAMGIHIEDDGQPILQRLAYEYESLRDQSSDYSKAFRQLAALEELPEIERARILALGRFGRLRRKREGEIIDSRTLLETHEKKVGESIENNLENQQAISALLSKLRVDFEQKLSADLIADYILTRAVDDPEADPFLRDAFTRGLERLGPAGLEAVVKAIGSDDKVRAGVALYALQGWRSAEGLTALMTEATTPGELSSSARIGLFRALRELGEEVPPEPIADWLSGNPKAAAGPRAAAIRVLTAMGARAGASVQPIVVGLLSDDQEEVRIAALPLAGMVRSDAAKAALVRLAQQPGLTSEQRRLAFASLRSYADSALAPVYSEALKTPAEPALRGEILRGLAALDFAQGAEAATSLLTDPSRELRAEAIAVLGQKPASALQVVTLYNAGKLPKEDLSRVIEAARPHKSPELSAAVNELMKSRMLGPSSLDDVRKFQDLVKRHGNADRGKSVYLDAAKANCASCHRLEGSGGAVGPDLTRVWETLSFEKKVESILDPSKEIKEGYNTYKVATKDGRIVSGLLLSDTAEAVTLKDAQGREIRIPVAEVDQKAVDKVSLMPEGVIAHLSLEEFVDLLAFLGDRQAQESLRPKP